MGLAKAVGIGCGSAAALLVAAPVGGYLVLKSMVGIDSSDPLDPEIRRGVCRDGAVRLAELTNVSWDQVRIGPSLEELDDAYGPFALRPFEGVDDPERQRLVTFVTDGELVAVVSTRLDVHAEGNRPLGRDAAVEPAARSGAGAAYRVTEAPSPARPPAWCGDSGR